MCFIASIILLFWIFVGTPNRIPYVVDAEYDNLHDREDESIVQLHDGTWVITCIDKYSPEHNAQRDLYCYILAVVNTAVVVGMCIWGLVQFLKIKRTYDVF